MNKATEVLLEAFEQSAKIDAVKRANKLPAKMPKKKIVEHTEKQKLSEADADSNLNIYRNVYKCVYDQLVNANDKYFNANEIAHKVIGYNPEWCNEEFDNTVEEALKAYAQAITDDLMKNFTLDESASIGGDCKYS